MGIHCDVVRDIRLTFCQYVRLYVGLVCRLSTCNFELKVAYCAAGCSAVHSAAGPAMGPSHCVLFWQPHI